MGFRICRPVGDGFGIKHHQIGVITLDYPPALAQAEALRRIKIASGSVRIGWSVMSIIVLMNSPVLSGKMA